MMLLYGLVWVVLEERLVNIMNVKFISGGHSIEVTFRSISVTAHSCKYHPISYFHGRHL